MTGDTGQGSTRVEHEVSRSRHAPPVCEHACIREKAVFGPFHRTSQRFAVEHADLMVPEHSSPTIMGYPDPSTLRIPVSSINMLKIRFV
jgi:hypothetical protein